MKELAEQLQEAINEIERWKGMAYEEDDEVGNAVSSIKDVIKKITPHPFNEGDDYYTIENNNIVWSCWDEGSEELHTYDRKYFTTVAEAKRYAKENNITINRIFDYEGANK